MAQSSGTFGRATDRMTPVAEDGLDDFPVIDLLRIGTGTGDGPAV
jgi:hypothetical protein